MPAPRSRRTRRGWNALPHPVPETASYPKIAQIAACGADVVTIKGSRQDVADAALRYAEQIFYAATTGSRFSSKDQDARLRAMGTAWIPGADNVVVPWDMAAMCWAASAVSRNSSATRNCGDAAPVRRAGGKLCAVLCGLAGGSESSGAYHGDVDRGGRHRFLETDARGRGACRGARFSGALSLSVKVKSSMRLVRWRDRALCRADVRGGGSRLSQLLQQGAISRDQTTVLVLTDRIEGSERIASC